MLKKHLNIEDTNFKEWLEAEHSFLKGLQEEPEQKALEVSYVEVLLARWRAEYVLLSYNLLYSLKI